MTSFRWRNLGVLPFLDALAIQRDLVQKRIAGEIGDVLLLVEHPSVITMGKTGKREHVLNVPPGVEVIESDRGGDVTWHGPGQLIGYPIIDLGGFKRDVKWYLERLEDVMIRTVARHGIMAERRPGQTGAWVGDAKIGAIGVRVQRWVTCHGFALNVAVDLDGFDSIVACGIPDASATSIKKETGAAVDPDLLRREIVETFGLVFDRKMEEDGA